MKFMNIFINKQIWNDFSEQEMISYKQEVFNHYRNHGFPYFPQDKLWRINEFQKFLDFNDSNMLLNGIIGQSMHGLAFCWSFMPHAFNVDCNGLKSPLNAFYDDDILKSVINKRIKFGDNISDNGIRKTLKIHTGVQSVSNFRPTAASVIYKHFAENKVVWDMSSGYGGRLLGAYKAGVKKYIGTEPCTETFNGLNEIVKYMDDFNKHLIIPYSKTEFELHQIGSQDFIPNEKVDLCFTSPPYFNTQKYSDEQNQSWKRYDTKEKWINDFLGKTFENCHQCMKDDALLMINIANVKSYSNLEEDCVKTAENKKFKLIDKMKYSLSNLSHIKEDKYKYEPIFIFKKKE